MKVGAAALVSGGIDDQDLKEILGYDLGVAVTGSEKIGLTLIVTEGFGEIAMAERTFRLLASRNSTRPPSAEPRKFGRACCDRRLSFRFRMQGLLRPAMRPPSTRRCGWVPTCESSAIRISA